MTDEQTTNTEPTETEPKESYSKDELKAYAEQRMREPLRRLTELEQQLRNVETEREKQDRERLAKNEEWKTLAEQEAEKRQAVEAKYQAELQAAQQRLVTMERDNLLAKAGVANEFILEGIKARYDKLEDAPEFGEWLEALKVEEPDLFGTTSRIEHRSSAAGVVKPRTIMSDAQLEANLKSSDPEVRHQASAEVLKELGLAGRRF